jgi:predicted HNH restriction endonuclease
MTINQNEIERYFSVNDEVATVTNKKIFIITEIVDNKIMIQPKASKTKNKYPLHYDKLSIIINNYDKIDPTDNITNTVIVVLRENGFKEAIDTETYLYSLASEYLNLKRQNLFSVSYIQSELEKAVEKSKKLNQTERDARLKNAPKEPKVVIVRSPTYQRNPDVIAAVLERANGFCEKCSLKAPFIKKKDETPYLEVHHKIQLSKGGDDTVENALSLCPNCHREEHFGINP